MEGEESAPPDYSVAGEGPLGPCRQGGSWNCTDSIP